MMLKKIHNQLFFSGLLFILPLLSLAQITVNFPVSRAVFQRNNANVGVISIVGTYAEQIERVDARLIPMVQEQGVFKDWVVVDAKPKAGNFLGKIEGFGGWYRLEIRAIKNATTFKTIVIERVGIGEIFVCAGQSNSEGVPNMNPKSAIDDRVNAANFSNSQLQYPLPEVFNFVKLTDNVPIAPAGNNAWCWGELGDKLAKRLNVPILFFNAGLSNTAIQNWRESAEGIPSRRYDLLIPGQTHFPYRYPYDNLRGALNLYGSILGMRAVLWCQGETDNTRTSMQSYQSDLQRVINYTRNDYDPSLSWVVAHTSRSYQQPPYSPVLQAQNNVINTPNNNVFGGPNTDNIQVPRPDGIHIGNRAGYGDGLSMLADAWNNSLDDNFFNNSRPIPPRDVLGYEIGCNSSNTPQIKFIAGMKSYQWSNGATSNQIADRGIFSLNVYDFRGNKLLTPSFATDFIYPTSQPAISFNKSLEFCAYDTANVELRATGNEFKDFQWNTGERNQRISVKTSGNFSVKGINEFNCLSSESNKIRTIANPIPEKPVITASAKGVCEGNAITLTTNPSERYQWSNGANTPTIRFDKVGDVETSVQVLNQFGCISPTSEKIFTTIKENPTPPEVAQIGTFTLGITNAKYIQGDKFEWKQNENTLQNTTELTLKTSTAADYKVIASRVYKVPDNQTITCVSKASNIVIFNPPNVLAMLYPNPVWSDVVSLETRENLKNLKLNFINAIGQTALQLTVDDTSKKNEINLASLGNGVYFVHIFNESFNQTIKIVVDRK